ncbi:hypothetical protein COHA_007578 [Chlorella ohadii]|uniref:Uncharacterized protein n=1 Tax=Chlorella ohadii TaxID=2649997 RepID=A0AAD5DIH0_9CHLO|nr:hypothetical protein COHA_007578 [Chlorella ohadii]
MLLYGAWIPQEVARSAGGGELLLEKNYDTAMRALRIAFTSFAGSGYGSGYQAFLAWAKQQLKRGKGVVEVAFLRGEPYDDCIQTTTDAFSAADFVYVNSLFSLQTTVRQVGGSPPYYCTVNNKQPLSNAGCLPQDYNPVYGRAIEGPVYAGIGPPTALTQLSSASEPDEAGRGYTIQIDATLVISGLKEGARYKVYKLTSLPAVPAAPNPALLSGPPEFEFTAYYTRHCQRVSFNSGSPAYYIAVTA